MLIVGKAFLFDDLWLTMLRDAMSAYAESQPGVELIMVDSKDDVAVQLGQVENFVAQGLDGIALIPANWVIQCLIARKKSTLNSKFST